MYFAPEACVLKRQAPELVTSTQTARPAPPLPGDITAADQLFACLDHSVIKTASHDWCLEVCGIHTHDTGNWVQVHLQSDCCHGVTVNVDQLSAQQVRSALTNWLATNNL